MPTYDNLSKTSEFFNGKWYDKMVEDLRLAGMAKRTRSFTRCQILIGYVAYSSCETIGDPNAVSNGRRTALFEPTSSVRHVQRNLKNVFACDHT